VLSDWAAIAIRNARLYKTVRERRDELERTMRGLETTTEISRALGGVTDLDRVLELVVKRSRALLDARTAEIALMRGDECVPAAQAGEPGPGDGDRIDAPMIFRNRTVGTLTVIDRLHGDRPFNEEDERLLQAFAASAATAVATAQNASEEALRRSIEASEAERTRWARELHDDTLQQLAGLRMLLSGARRSGDPDRIATAIDDALEQITTAIGDLRSLITELRPAALDELGTKPALESLAARFERQTDIEVDLDVTDVRFTREVESTVYRLVQEALTNIAKHAQATRVAVEISERDGEIALVVRDDGSGFDPRQQSSGFGLIGMRERLALVNGSFDIRSSPGAGTELRATIPSGG
jgi:signal transduction histidine kinase